MGRLSRRDLLATVFVLGAGIVYLLWLRDAAFTGVSIRVMGAIVLGLGFAACTADADGAVAAFGAKPGVPRAPIAYLVLASALGVGALVTGILTLVWASETMLAALVATTFALWLLTIVRHAAAAPAPHPAPA